MNNITTRPATITDLPTLYEFEQGIVTTERPMDSTLKEGHINYYDIKAMILSNDVEVVVAVNGEEIVGSGYVKIKTAKPYLKFDLLGYIGFMFVKPENRGQGVSQKILEALKTWAQSRNLTELRLDVYDVNPSAIAAYEKFGFKKNMVEMRIEV